MNDSLLAAAVSFFWGLIFVPSLIPMLRKLKFGQQIRSDGPQGHLKKAGTPTMGGLAFILAVTVCCLLFWQRLGAGLPLLLVFLGCGLIGFTDDFLEIVKKQNEGLKPLQKLALQILAASAFFAYWMLSQEEPFRIFLPFSGRSWDMPWWLFVPLFFLTFLGTDNGVNLNDGIDGLCASVTLVISLFLALLSVHYQGNLEWICLAVAGSLLAYLIFNVNPAKLFMGDTGSLALGGFVAGAFIMLRQPLMVLIAGFIYFAESLSVIIQRYYFKGTHGKRFFRMTPIHHHFELGGWSEPRIVIVFTTVTLWCCVLAYYLAGGFHGLG